MKPLQLVMLCFSLLSMFACSHEEVVKGRITDQVTGDLVGAEVFLFYRRVATPYFLKSSTTVNGLYNFSYTKETGESHRIIAIPTDTTFDFSELKSPNNATKGKLNFSVCKTGHLNIHLTDTGNGITPAFVSFMRIGYGEILWTSGFEKYVPRFGIKLDNLKSNDTTISFQLPLGMSKFQVESNINGIRENRIDSAIVTGNTTIYEYRY